MNDEQRETLRQHLHTFVDELCDGAGSIDIDRSDGSGVLTSSGLHHIHRDGSHTLTIRWTDGESHWIPADAPELLGAAQYGPVPLDEFGSMPGPLHPGQPLNPFGDEPGPYYPDWEL